MRGPRGQVERLRAIRADIRATRALAEQTIDTSAELTSRLQACLADLASIRHKLEQIDGRTAADHQAEMHALRIVRDDDAAARERLWNLRQSDEYGLAFDEDEPLVTIIITTYNNWPLLRERSLPSVLAQTYQRFECIVVGDAAPADADAAVASFGDSSLALRQSALPRPVSTRAHRRLAGIGDNSLQHRARTREGQVRRAP